MLDKFKNLFAKKGNKNTVQSTENVEFEDNIHVDNMSVDKQETEEVSPSEKKKSNSLIVIGGLLLVFISVAFYAYTTFMTKNKVNKTYSMPISQNIPEQPPVNNIDPTAQAAINPAQQAPVQDNNVATQQLPTANPQMDTKFSQTVENGDKVLKKYDDVQKIANQALPIGENILKSQKYSNFDDLDPFKNEDIKIVKMQETKKYLKQQTETMKAFSELLKQKQEMEQQAKTYQIENMPANKLESKVNNIVKSSFSVEMDKQNKKIASLEQNNRELKSSLEQMTTNLDKKSAARQKAEYEAEIKKTADQQKSGALKKLDDFHASITSANIYSLGSKLIVELQIGDEKRTKTVREGDVISDASFRVTKIDAISGYITVEKKIDNENITRLLPINSFTANDFSNIKTVPIKSAFKNSATSGSSSSANAPSKVQDYNTHQQQSSSVSKPTGVTTNQPQAAANNPNANFPNTNIKNNDMQTILAIQQKLNAAK